MADAPKRTAQILGAITVALGAFSLGNVIGWYSPAEAMLKAQLDVSSEELSWVPSIMPIGAALSQIYMAITVDCLGRKLSMIILSIPLVLGWLLLSFGSSIGMFMAGRFVTGFAAGGFCVAAPTYIGETADKGIRGTLGVFFQLLLVIGILVAFILGLTKSVVGLTLPLVLAPLIFIVVMFLFFPETPVNLASRGKIEKAQKSLQFFRGKDYNITAEMKEIEDSTKSTGESFWSKFKTRACIKAFIMLIVMHTIQQLSGINVVMFYAESIFEMAGSSLSPAISAIVLAIVQVLFCAVSASLIDKAGRKLLWIISLALMALSLVVIGIYFMVKSNDEEKAREIAWIPLCFICVYLAGFSLGGGPLPWVMIGEFLPNSVKGYLGPFIAFFNWVLAFGVTKSFGTMKDALGPAMVFWIFAIVCVLGIVFVIVFLLETRNKTLDEIQTELGTPPT